MRLLFLLGILILNIVAFVASQTDRDEAYQLYAASPRLRRLHVNSAAESEVKFAAKLVQEVAKRNRRNFMIFPLGTAISLGVLSIGARRYTDYVFRTTLGFKRDHLPRKIAYQTMLRQLNGMKEVEFEIATGIFLPIGIRPDDIFIDTAMTAFNATVKMLDFRKSNESSNVINEWSEKQTHGHITKLVEAADFNEDTGLVLVNAGYLRGTWLHHFDVNKTQELPFFVDGKTEKRILTMVGRQPVLYGEYPEVKSKFIELPFKGEGATHNISMFIILPTEKDGLDYLEENFDKISLKVLQNISTIRDTIMQLPKFKIQSETDLEEPLKAMGMENIFDPLRADFSNIIHDDDPYFDDGPYTSESISGTRGFYVNKIIQKGYIEITEGRNQPTDDADFMVSSVIGLSTEPAFFMANHPFMVVMALTGDSPLNLFTARFSGSDEPSSFLDALLDVTFKKKGIF